MAALQDPSEAFAQCLSCRFADERDATCDLIVSITACGFTRENCIQVNPEGEGVLEELREELEKLRYEEVVKALASR